MRAHRTLNYAGNYVNGFSDVYNHESLSKTFTGLIKIISYALIIPPIIFGWMYLKSKKINEIQTEIDSKIDSGRIQEIFTKLIITQNNQEIGQNKMINYLINKLENFEKTDNEVLERSRFEKGFRKLSFESQQEFFKMANECKCLGMALKWIPKDITELNFISGPPNPIHKSSINKCNISLLLEELPKFNHLERIKLNLKGLGFYSPSVNGNVQTMILGKNVFAYTEDSRRIFEFEGYQYYHKNDTMPIVKTIVAIKNLIQKKPDLVWEVNFMNFGLSCKGTLLRHSGEMGYTTNLITYFHKIG